MNKTLSLIYLFVASALVMYIEIIGAKFLTPFLGGSHVVWISQILITLFSLAVGAFLSSYIKESKHLGYILVGSSSYFLVVLFLIGKIIPLTENLSLIASSIFFASVLYLIPLVSLGMTFPFFTGILNKNYNLHLGIISFISTLGSVFGTVLTYFVILWGSNSNLLICSGLLFVIYSFLFLRLNGLKTKKMELLVFVLFLASATLSQNEIKEKNEVVFFKNSHFGEVSIVKENENYIIYNDRIVQNGFNEDLKSSHLFTYALRILPQSVRQINSALILGLGAGIVAKELKDSSVEVEAVEINPVMVEIARDFLKTEVPTYIGDSRVFIKKTKKKYDLVVHDCFLVDSVPKYLLTKEAFSEIGNILNEQGILIINSFGITKPNDYLTNATYETLKSVFPFVRVYSLNQYNVFYMASFKPIEMEKIKFSMIPPEFVLPLTNLVLSEVKEFAKVPILEDNWSSIEFYDNSPRELYRKRFSLKN